MATNALILLKAGGENKSNFLSQDFVEQIKDIPEQRYFNLIASANTALNDLRYTNQQQIPLEVFLVESTNQEVVPTTAAAPVTSPVVEKQAADGQELQAEVTALKRRFATINTQTSRIANRSIMFWKMLLKKIYKQSKMYGQICNLF